MSSRGNESAPVILVLLIVTIISIGAVLLGPLVENFQTGNAFASFGASSSVRGITFLNDSFVQHDIPITDGPDVLFSMPIIYSGSGLVNITATKPSGFTNGFNWYVNESGVIKPVADMAENIRWEANFSLANATLYFEVLAPLLITLVEAEEDTVYSHLLRAISENHFTNILATTNIETEYSDFKFYELVGANWILANATYNFSVVGNEANWSGFNLSFRDFLINGTKEADSDTVVQVVGGSGGGGGAGFGLSILPEVEEEDEKKISTGFELNPDLLEVDMEKGDEVRVKLILTNKGSIIQTFNIRSTVSFARVLTKEIILSPDEEAEVLVLLRPENYGEHSTRIIVSNRFAMEQTFITVYVNIPVMDDKLEEIPITVETPGLIEEVSSSSIFRFVNAKLLLFLLTLLAIIFFAFLVQEDHKNKQTEKLRKKDSDSKWFGEEIQPLEKTNK